ncbi:MAG: cache domain-containing protein, partial [Treponema sp.]
MEKRFSLKNKLVLIFGALIAIGSLVEGLLAVNIARKAVVEKIEVNLTDKAGDVAEIIDGRISAFFQFLDGLARMPEIRDDSIPLIEKMRLLHKEAQANSTIRLLYIADTKGTIHDLDGTISVCDTTKWFQEGMLGNESMTEPYTDKANKAFVSTYSVPVYDDNKKLIGVIGADIDGLWLSEQIKDITVGKTGYTFIVGKGGTDIAHPNTDLVTQMWNTIEKSRTDTSMQSTAEFEKTAMSSEKSSVGFYNYKGVNKIASYAKMKTTGWTVIINAPVGEFMDTMNALRASMFAIGGIILVIAVIVVYLVAQAMVKPIQTTVAALKNIAQGEGDLTVRLPIHGNDEIADLSSYFNETIAKIGAAIKNVDQNANVMQSIGDTLSSDMTETASAINEISSNID